jgi:hypothetical protein
LAREAPPLSSFALGVSPELERILASMLAKDCRQRPAHAREAAERLRSFALRQRSAPATDVPTAQAGYGAETAAAAAQPRPRTPSPIHDSVTRPEGAARHRLASDANRSEDALTQRMAITPGTTQVTLSASTGDAFSISSVQNTTFVSPPPFEGTTTLQMAIPTRTPSSVPPASEPAIERPERTEMLGEFPVPVLLEPADTRTQVPVAEQPRPVSITPPPVVDTGRVDGAAAPRAPRVGRWAGWLAAGLGLLLVSAFVLRRAALPSESSADTAVNAAPPVPLKPQPPSTPAPNRVESGPQPPTAVSGSPSAPPALVAESPSSATSARVGAAPAGSAAQRNLRMIFDGKRAAAPSFAGRALAPGASTGPVHGNASRASGPAMPGSGL